MYVINVISEYGTTEYARTDGDSAARTIQEMLQQAVVPTARVVIKVLEETTDAAAMRDYDTGATRDSNTNKLSYLKGLSSQVLQRYLEYLNEHRVQADGKLRDWDTWKKGIPLKDYMDSLDRHAHDAVRAFQGLPVPENASLEALLCAIMFNSMGGLFELLVAKSGNREEEAKCGS